MKRSLCSALLILLFCAALHADGVRRSVVWYPDTEKITADVYDMVVDNLSGPLGEKAAEAASDAAEGAVKSVDAIYEDFTGAVADEVYAEVTRSLQSGALRDELVETVSAEVAAETEAKISSAVAAAHPFEQRGFFFDGYAHLTLVRGSDLVPGGTISFGWREGVSLYGLYTRFDYFLEPLGSSTGRLATIEFNLEPGISLRYVVTSQDWQEVKIGADLGWYMQWIERAGQATVFHLTCNGLMVRPTISVKANLMLFRIELGLYYQSAIYPRYEGYDGWGIYLKLF